MPSHVAVVPGFCIPFPWTLTLAEQWVDHASWNPGQKNPDTLDTRFGTDPLIFDPRNLPLLEDWGQWKGSSHFLCTLGGKDCPVSRK